MSLSSSTSSFELGTDERVPATSVPRALIAFVVAVVCLELVAYRERVWFADLAGWQWDVKAQMVAERQLDGEIGVFGSSISFHALDPVPANQAIGNKRKVVNLALNGQTLQHSTQLLERYADRNPRLQVVVLEVWNLDVEHESWLRGPYYRFWAEWREFLQSRIYYWEPASVAGFAANRALPSFRYREALDNWLSNCIRQRGLSAETKKRNLAVALEMQQHAGFAHGDDFDSALLAAADVPPVQERPWNIASAADVWLNRFVAECRYRGLPLVLLLPPAPPHVAADRSRSGYDAGFERYVAELRSHHEIAIETVKFAGFQRADFADDHHLNLQGRRRLSDEFAAWLAKSTIGKKAE